MATNTPAYRELLATCTEANAILVAVSKTKTPEDIQALYNLGQRDFGENCVQELVEKQQILPSDIRWHFIGHLQSNKVKYIASFVHLIHGVDSEKLLKEINKQGAKNNRVIKVLLQVHIATEETKFGLDEGELASLLNHELLLALPNVSVVGLMGMASFSPDMKLVEKEFSTLATLFHHHKKNEEAGYKMDILSMGMSGDFKLAMACGSNMVRIGSLIFGARG